jgi:hypothetical protein
MMSDLSYDDMQKIKKMVKEDITDPFSEIFKIINDKFELSMSAIIKNQNEIANTNGCVHVVESRINNIETNNKSVLNTIMAVFSGISVLINFILLTGKKGG